MAPAASGYVYWSNSLAGTIGRANLDGTDVNQSFITGASYPSGVAVDGNYIYWTNSSIGSIGRANLDGTGANQSFITGLSSPEGVTVSGSFVYWANQGTNTIGRADLSGSPTTVITHFITGASYPSGVALDGNYIYWTKIGPSAIGRAELNGSSPNQSFITGASYPLGVAVNGNFIYWTNSENASIGRADLDGSPTTAIQSLVTGASYPYGVAVDDDFVYWTNRGDVTIGRANLDGTGANQSFITTSEGSQGIAVDSLPAAGSLSPTSKAFGDQLVSAGPTSAETFSLSSSGTADLTIPASGISVAGTDADMFQVTGGTCSAGSSSLADTESCTVTVTFDPSSTGAKSATLEVQTNDGTKTVSLTGTGTSIPMISGVGKPTKRALKARVGCGDSGACTLRLIGKKVGTNAAIWPKTISVGAGRQPSVTLIYTRTLKKALARGGRVRISATNTATDNTKSIIVRVPR